MGTQSPALRNDKVGEEIADFLEHTRGFSTRLHYVEYLELHQVHSMLQQELPASARNVVDVAKRAASESEACRELLRLWAWSIDTHMHFPVSHRRFVFFLLLVFRRLRLIERKQAHEGGSSALQRVFVAHA